MRGGYSPWISWLFCDIATYGDRVNVDGTGRVCVCVGTDVWELTHERASHLTQEKWRR